MTKRAREQEVCVSKRSCAGVAVPSAAAAALLGGALAGACGAGVPSPLLTAFAELNALLAGGDHGVGGE
jgi:hypothetical protein